MVKSAQMVSLVSFACLCVGCLQADEPDSGKVTIGNIRWHTSYDQALKEAKQQDKLLWLHFGENPG